MIRYFIYLIFLFSIGYLAGHVFADEKYIEAFGLSIICIFCIFYFKDKIKSWL